MSGTGSPGREVTGKAGKADMPANQALVQVCPTERGGVSDYLECLQVQWHAEGLASDVVPLSQTLAQARPLHARIADLLQARQLPAASGCAVVLHFSGYGYGQRGLCFWLLRELQAVRARWPGSLRLVVVFHELFASGPPWRSAFWLSRMQALIAARLAHMADAIWTNTELHAAWLRKAVTAGTPVHARPVFSNIGEPDGSPPLAARAPRVVVFGSAATRQRAFDALPVLVPQLQLLGVHEIVEAGGGTACRGLPAGIPCRHAGRLEVEALRELLHGSRYGLLDYPAQYLAKSGVFAAYAAHGCSVLDTRPPMPDSDGLTAGSDYIALHSLDRALDLPDLQASATRLRQWYAQHCLARQSRELLALAGLA